MIPTTAATNAGSTGPRATAPTPAAISFDGAALNIDHAAYLAQHDVVYQTPPLVGSQAMPIGDGDLGASIWCPGCLRLQIQKSDLWSDPAKTPDGSPGPAENWSQLAAGCVSIFDGSSLLEEPRRYEQRLSLYSGTIGIQSDATNGSCQITAFASATAGVLVIHYEDQTLRNSERHIELSLWRDAHVFALNETIGVIQALRDRRYAMIARVGSKRAVARMQDRRTASLDIEPARSSHFTVYVAVATSPRDGDPIRIAKARIDAAIEKGYDVLLREHKQHWSLFWQKSFVKLSGGETDSPAAYLENLWYLSLYQIAACSRGFDAPLSNGGLFLNNEDRRAGAAVYRGADLRAIMGALLPSNHLELSVPCVDTYHRLLPDLGAVTGSEFGVGGVRLPARFNRNGDEFPEDPPANRPSATGNVPLPRTAASNSASASASDLPSLHPTAIPLPESPNHADARKALGDGLDAALLVWNAWRYAPDPFFLQERAYPILRACTAFAHEYALLRPECLDEAETRAKLAAALRALVWASAECGVDSDLRPDWHAAYLRLDARSSAYIADQIHPFHLTASSDLSTAARRWLADAQPGPQGLFRAASGSPSLRHAGEIVSGISSLLVGEVLLPSYLAFGDSPGSDSPITGFGGVAPSAVSVFPKLPSTWNAACTLAAPGGFRISSEAVNGKARYVAVKSLLGGTFRLVNPWGEGVRVRIVDGRVLRHETSDAIIEFETTRGTVYLLERADNPIMRTVRVRMTGRKNEAPKYLDDYVLGLDRLTE